MSNEMGGTRLTASYDHDTVWLTITTATGSSAPIPLTPEAAVVLAKHLFVAAMEHIGAQERVAEIDAIFDNIDLSGDDPEGDPEVE